MVWLIIFAFYKIDTFQIANVRYWFVDDYNQSTMYTFFANTRYCNIILLSNMIYNSKTWRNNNKLVMTREIVALWNSVMYALGTFSLIYISIQNKTIAGWLLCHLIYITTTIAFARYYNCFIFPFPWSVISFEGIIV